MTHRFNVLLIVLAMLAGLPFYWLLLENSPGAARAHPLDIARLRSLAGRIEGTRPAAVELEVVALRRASGDYLAAGTGLKGESVCSMAFRLAVPAGRPILIDTAVVPGNEAPDEWRASDPGARARVDGAMREAGLLLATEIDTQHNGALIRAGRSGSGADSAHGKFLGGSRQWAALAQATGGRSGSRPRPASPAPFAVAPGVVAIPAPGHTPGSQMIYVRLASGREYLFAGDNAILSQSWMEQRNHSRLMSDWREPEDRQAVRSWLMTIARLHRQAPGLVVVPGGDCRWLLDPASGAEMRGRFQTAQTEQGAGIGPGGAIKGRQTTGS